MHIPLLPRRFCEYIMKLPEIAVVYMEVNDRGEPAVSYR